LREIGIQPDILICRSEKPLSKEDKQKIALFCNVEPNAVIEELDKTYSIYEVPISLSENQLDELIVQKLGLNAQPLDISDWKELLQRIRNPAHEVTIAVVGKYIRHHDAYKSIYEALDHGGLAHTTRVSVRKVDAEEIEREGPQRVLADCDGILVPGGFGDRGIEGKIEAIRYAREKQIPFFGICLGMQCAVIEFARNVLRLEDANSTEFDRDTPHPVICLMEEQRQVADKGGTMRLGAYPCQLREGSRIRAVYGQPLIWERHRHRYEFNNAYRTAFESAGMVASGLSPDGKLVEAMELPEHPWFVAVQYHPEFKSKPTRPHPLFVDFVRAALVRKESRRSLDFAPGKDEKTQLAYVARHHELQIDVQPK
ncbi:MAG: CTP synthase, partial [Gemmatales bacterium]|nr:CTP synthase [Gemmatales bacterium]